MSLRTFRAWRAGAAAAALAAWAVSFGGSSFATAQDETPAAPAASDAADAGEEEGFTPLLGEKAKEQWVGYGTETWPEGWEVEDGALHRKTGGNDLRTVEQYRNFDLRWEWKAAPGANSGVLYRVSQQDTPSYQTGLEYQILDNAKHADGKSPLTSAASIYAMYAPAKDVTKPAGEWNESRIVIRGNRVRHFLNGEEVVSAQIGSDDWNERLAKSKFAAWEGFATNRRGHIAVQDHGDEVWYRNMRIKELPRRGGRGAGREGRRGDQPAEAGEPAVE